MKTAMKTFLIAILVLAISMAFVACGEKEAQTAAEPEPAAEETPQRVEGLNGSWKSNEFESSIGNIYICLQINDETFTETVYSVDDESVIEVNEGSYVVEGEKILVEYPNMQGALTIYRFTDGVLTGGQYVYERVG